MGYQNNNNQASDQDNEPTLELEPLSEKDCARLALAAESSDESDSVAEHDEVRKPEAAIADQSALIEKLKKNNRQLTDTVSALEEELDLARRKSDDLEIRLGEARKESDKRYVEPQRSESVTAVKLDESRWVLVSLDDSLRETYSLSEGVVTVGSGPDNDIYIQSHFISCEHAQFVNSNKASVVGDLNSTNGTYVNSRRVNKRVLRAGDVVTFGKHRFRYEEQSGSSPGHEQGEYDYGEHSHSH